MGHQIEYYSFKTTEKKEKICSELDDYMSEATWKESKSGLPNPIRWIDKLFDNYDDAVNYINHIDKGWYDQIAVKYLVYPRITEHSKKHDELVKKHAELMKKHREITGKIHYKDVKSQYIGCKHCGSKINKDYLTQNHCPICRQDLRPQSVLDSIEKMKLKLVQLQEDIKKEEKKEQEKYKKRAEEHWLVKIEYHV